MITVNYICDRCGTYFDADELVIVDVSNDNDVKFSKLYELCPGCATKLITKFMEKEESDDPTNN